jgi:formylmethanofuran dehydrogenase subunit E
VQTVTGCTLGHRSLKYADYGRFAATFVNLSTGRAVRATVKEHFSNEDTIEATLAKLARVPDSELITMEEVVVDIPEEDMPGSPRRAVVCAVCGERVVDGREVMDGERALCRACAGESYYRPVGK